MKWIITLHRLLSGVAILVLTGFYAGIDIQDKLLTGILAATLVFYILELLLLSIIAILNITRVDIIYPTLMLFSVLIGLKALMMNRIDAVLLPILVMFVFGYIAAGGADSESSRVHQSEENKGEN